MRTIKPRVRSGKPNQDFWPWEAAHAAVSRQAASEGFVLLKNEGLLPLDPAAPIALYGAGATRTVKGGTGSGDVNERHSVSIAEGLRAAGFTLTTEDWLAHDLAVYDEAHLAWRDRIVAEHEAHPEKLLFMLPFELPFEEPKAAPITATAADTAVYVISRIAGEGADRSCGKGDYCLSEDEEIQLASVCAAYTHVAVIINAGGQIDCSFMDRYANIEALLVVSQPGMEGGHAVADVLCGKVNPSGRLTDTWAYAYLDYPAAATFGRQNGDTQHERYTEGIYVGYRYFDTFEVPVRYGFGDGLSYTTFSMTAGSVTADAEGKVTVPVTVTNTGDCAGKQVVQVYASLPYVQAEKEARRLVAFGKTSLLQPGCSETLCLIFTADDLASFCEKCSAYRLDQGLYGVEVGASLREAKPVAVLKLMDDVRLRSVPVICPPQEELDTLRCDPAKRMARYQALQAAAASLPVIPYQVKEQPAPVPYVQPQDEAAEIAARLTVEQCVKLVTGDPALGQGSFLGSAGITVPGSAAETSSCAVEDGVAPIVLADGPAGLRLNDHYYVKDGRVVPQGLEVSMNRGFFCVNEADEGDKYYQYCTAYPVGTLLAQTWDAALIAEVGEAVGEELRAYQVTLWLAPGMNIHRNPLCGRNFEYYSEDPLVSGRTAAAMTNGVQRVAGVGTTIKHFACNNLEDNRMGCDSILSMRALREIYLRGFGIAIRESQPFSIMTSYNLVNGVHAANNRDLCTVYAREECGFRGVIMTDWTTTNHGPDCTASGCVRAGNDLVMPGMPMDHENLREELKNGTLSEEELRGCVARIIRCVLSSASYED